MKGLIIHVMALLLVAGSAHAAYIGLYTDESALDCDFAPEIFVPFDVHVLYIWDGAGLDSIAAFEFMLEIHSDYVFVSDVTWQPGFVTLGNIESGISVATAGCYGAGSEIDPLGTIQLFVTTAPLSPNDYIRIVPDPTALEPGIWVAHCEWPFELYEVLGYWFKFVENTCNAIAVETTSWGAIKSMFSE